MTTYTQLWAWDPALSIPTLAVAKCKFLILAETFSAQTGSNFREGLFPPRFLSLLTVRAHGDRERTTAAAPRPSKIGEGRSVSL